MAGPARPRRLVFEWALVAAVSTVAVALLVLGHLTVRADNVVYDLLSQAGVHAPQDDIVIVAIDNRSVQELGRWPWPRVRHAEMLRRLAAYKPRAVAYDVLFVDPDPDPAQDADLASAIRGLGKVLLPVTFDVPGENGAPFRLTPPVPPLRAAAAGLGQVNLQFDPDGVVRRAMLAEDDGTTTWPLLMESAYRLVNGRHSSVWDEASGRARDGKTMGLWRSRPMLIPFAGPPGHFRTVAFSDLLRGQTPPAFLRNKLVLVGATADGLGDRYSTPLSGGQEVMPGVEVQANVMDALLTGRAIRPLSTPLALLASLVPVWLMLTGFLTLRPRANMVLGVGLVLLVLAGSAAALVLGRLWIPPAAALLGLVLVYPFWSWRRLEASSAYMLAELKRFGEEPELLPAIAGQRAEMGEDVVAREVQLMRAAVGRMRELRRFVDDTLQGLPDAVMVVGLEGEVSLANRAARRLFEGPTGQSCQGRPVATLLDTLGKGEADDELTMAGSVFQLRREPLTSTRGEAIGEIVRLTDISALRAAARQREQVLQLLSHDMRSPQVSILALLDEPGADRPTAKLARRIETYARRTLALADDFVHLARAESVPLDLELLDLSALTMEAADDLWPQAKAKGVAVTSEAGEDECLVLADRSLMTRALINLVGNGVKYTPQGGKVDCAVAAEGDEVVVRIADTGGGMAPAQLARLFERFHRGAAAKSSDGVGLGLAFVQTVVERHGGRMSCDSVEGEGSTFTLRFARALDGA
jgi:CHASE2 domain-containing sensor protein/signal transduction histidine kinase